MRTRAQVEDEIQMTRDALLIADEQQAWEIGDELLDYLRQLWHEIALLPHVPNPRLPSERDGHSTPKPS
jgi:hypothetical protein